MGDYLAQRIIDEAFSYKFVISKKPNLKNEIDTYLTKMDRADLIESATQ